MPLPGRFRRTIAGALVALPAMSYAQPAPVLVRGIAFDGLRGRPLRDARITLVGGNKFVTSDARGRFQFDSVPPGVHTFALQHAALDSLGFNGFSTRATITNGRDEVRISLPSFATLWNTACGGPMPDSAGFVYGTIRDAENLRPVANATVVVTWTEMVMQRTGRNRTLVQRRSRSESRTDSTGSYTACGVSASTWLRIQAARDSSSSAPIDLSPNSVRLQRRDLLLGQSMSDTTGRGTIIGLVTDSEGRVFAEARVILDGQREIRSGVDGRFILRNVPTGTRQLEVNAVGLVPLTLAVDVTPRDSAAVAAQFSVPVSLNGVRVTATRGRALAEEFTARRKLSMGHTMDSTEVMRFQTLQSLFGTFPSLSVAYRSPFWTITMPKGAGTCIPDIRIDGVEAGFGHVIDLAPAEVAGLEVYNRALIVPAQFARAGHPPECGMILIWTKYGFRNR
jgi:hypothetical protein